MSKKIYTIRLTKSTVGKSLLYTVYDKRLLTYSIIIQIEIPHNQ
jgi:hypothetical protein